MKIPRDWTFKKFSIAKGFDRHVREQLPWYDLATGIVRHIVRHYLNRGGLVYDIGANGQLLGQGLLLYVMFPITRLLLEIQLDLYDLGLDFKPTHFVPDLLRFLFHLLKPSSHLMIVWVVGLMLFVVNRRRMALRCLAIGLMLLLIYTLPSLPRIS